MPDPTERWLPISGWEDFYEVSDCGWVRSLDRLVGGPLGPDTRLLRSAPRKTVIGPDGYPRVMLCRNGKIKCYLVHRLVALAFHGEPLPGQEARHLDGNPAHIDPSNLKWGTQSENNYDRVRHGTHQHAIKRNGNCGHPLFPPNLQNSKDGGRRCLTCDRARGRARWRGIKKDSPEWFDLLDECYAEIMGNNPPRSN